MSKMFSAKIKPPPPWALSGGGAARKVRGEPEFRYLRNSRFFFRFLPFRIRGHVEAVPPPWFGVNIFWLGWIEFNFFSKLVDHHAQRFRLFAILRPPDRLQQPAMGDRPPIRHHQFLQHSEFLGRQMNWHSPHLNVALLEIKV